MSDISCLNKNSTPGLQRSRAWERACVTPFVFFCVSTCKRLFRSESETKMNGFRFFSMLELLLCSGTWCSCRILELQQELCADST
mgnify:CR=1 FL=1